MAQSAGMFRLCFCSSPAPATAQPADVPALSLCYCAPFNQASMIRVMTNPGSSPCCTTGRLFQQAGAAAFQTDLEKMCSPFCACVEKLKHFPLAQCHSAASGNYQFLFIYLMFFPSLLSEIFIRREGLFSPQRWCSLIPASVLHVLVKSLE